MNQQDRDRIIEKVKKCMALSKSANTHEAAAALRQAQKLMAAYGIDSAEISSITSAVAVSVWHWNPKKIHIGLASIIAVITKAFGCEAILEPTEHRTAHNDRAWTAVRYFGPEGVAAVAAWTHVVVNRAVWQAWHEHRKIHADAKRSDFIAGWCLAVRKTVEDFARPAEVVEATRKAIARQCGIAMEEMGSPKMDGFKDDKSVTLGMDAAKDFRLHRPMDGAKVAQIGHEKL